MKSTGLSKIASPIFFFIDFFQCLVSDYISRLVLSFSRQVVQTRFLNRHAHTNTNLSTFGLDLMNIWSKVYSHQYFSNLEIEVMSSKFKSMSKESNYGQTPFLLLLKKIKYYYKIFSFKNTKQECRLLTLEVQVHK